MKKNIVVISIIILILNCALRSVGQAENKKEESPLSQQQLITLINNLIKANQAFTIQLSNPLWQGKVRLWQQTGKVQLPAQQITWEVLKRDIHQFGTYLASLLTKDPQTGTYYHLERLKKDQPLITSLRNLHQALIKHARTPEQDSSFKLSKESKKPIKGLVDAYATQFYRHRLIEALKNFFQQFETEAKELRSKEEKAVEQAATQQKSFEEMPDIDFDYSSTGFDFDEDLNYLSNSSSEYDMDSIQDSNSSGNESEIDDFIASFFE